MKSLGLILCIVFTFALYTQAQVVSPSIPTIPGVRQQTFNINKANYALWWYGAALQAARINSTVFAGPLLPTRSYAILCVAIHNAVNAYNPVNEFYPAAFSATPPTNSDIDAAIAGAGYQSLLRLYPNRVPDWTIIYRTQLALLKRFRNGIPNRPIRQGFQFGRTMADVVYNSRSADGAFTLDQQPYSNAGGPGLWVPTPPLFQGAVGAGWKDLQPWVIPTGSSFRPPGPPFGLPQYSAEYLEVFDKGIFPGLGPSTRTPLETYTALFFAVEASGQTTPPGQYMETAYTIALDARLNRADTARFVALTALAQADAAITAWDAKYFYGHWRPLNAIINNTNASLPNNPNWFPLLELTPPFPDYVSGHSTFGGAVTRIWQNWFNTDSYTFRVVSDTLPGVNAVYRSFSQFATDNAFSRVYAGVHFRKSCLDGVNAGIAVADYVWQNVLRPL